MTLKEDRELLKNSEQQIYSILFDNSNVDGVRILYEDRWPVMELRRYISKLLEAQKRIDREEIIKRIATNQKGQFEDDAGNICWYLDDLINSLKKQNE